MEQKVTVQNRFRSWGLWTAVAGAIWIVITKVLGYEPIAHETFLAVLDAIGVILIAFGIINVPTNKGHI
jgi:uncharacterized membrane protein